MARNFGPEKLTLDTTWAADVTYVRTWEGWAYLATVIDLASWRIVGWANGGRGIYSGLRRVERLITSLGDPSLPYGTHRSQYRSEQLRVLLENRGKMHFGLWQGILRKSFRFRQYNPFDILTDCR